MIQETERDILSNGIRHTVHRFAASNPSGDAKKLLLLHGFLDAGGTWDLVAQALAKAGYDVYAPDLRGFGKSERVPPGGYYHFADYIADVDGLATAIAGRSGGWLGVVGHSMGGTIASLFAGTRPERVAKLAILEGLGPPIEPPEQGVHRMRNWLEDLERVSRSSRTMESIDEATKRLAATHPKIDRAVLRSRAEKLVTFARDGKVAWAHDPLHRTRSPIPFQLDVYRSFLSAITCPTLFVSGGADGWRTPDEGERLACIPNARSIELPSAGHMMHRTSPRELAVELLAFFAAD